jgi:eukaryotic-like serine/threonine-protein kinase
MTLPAGRRLGAYEILSPIGAGGMGEVYTARDTRLGRVVAIKLLSPDVADRPDRRARFETEARAISSLSHPSICTLFDVGEQDGRAFLVMEHLEGETLDDRLERGALPLSEVLRHAADIADALDHAHRARFVHRDLKPANVMLTGTGAKLLDFGIARGPTTDADAPSATVSFDLQKLTADGALIGTLQYMAPEQLEGKPADARTDIFAFGALLYEMATGRKAFAGKSRAALIASILTEQPPPISSLCGSAESDRRLMALDHVIERCLAKNPDERWQDVRDVRRELDWIGTSRYHSGVRLARRARGVRRATAWLLGVVAVAAAAVVALKIDRSVPSAVARFAFAPPSGAIIGLAENRPRLAISPDGRRIAFVALSRGTQQIWVRPLDSTTAYPIDGTEGGTSPFWSPNSRFIGFFSPGDGELKKVDAAGGPPRTICAAESDGVPTWGSDGTILFTQFREGIFRVPAEGGTPTQVTHVDRERGEMNHYWPAFLPGGRRFLYMATSRDSNGLRKTPVNYVVSLDSTEIKPVASLHSSMTYAPPGHLLFMQNGALLAQRFDLSTLQLQGEPQAIADGLAYFRTLGTAGFSVSQTGVLAYQGGVEQFGVAWYDRRGIRTDTGWPKQHYSGVRISRDAQRVATSVFDPRIGTADIWIFDPSGNAPARLTSDLENEKQPLWSPDRRQIVFASDGLGAPSLMMKTMESGAQQQVFRGSTPLVPEDWSPDGRWIAYVSGTRQTGRDLWLLRTEDRIAKPFLTTRFEESAARFSPDGAWLAFVSNETGRPEVYVAPIAAPGEKRAISMSGGLEPRWRADGRELYYVSADGRSIMAVPVFDSNTFKTGAPVRLFSPALLVTVRDRAADVIYDVSADGRFLIAEPSSESTSSLITVVLNWAAAMRP